MERRIQFEGRVVALAAATVVLLVLALLNLRQVWLYRPPTDGVLWQRTTSGLEAAAVDPSAPNPVHRGDLLVAVGAKPVATPAEVAQAVYAAGRGATLAYTVLRGQVLLPLAVAVRAEHVPLARYAFLEVVGFLYLAIGLFVLDRRRSASRALHFFLFCLASFVLFTFHFTGKLNLFDHAIFWGNEAALLLAPCLLVHFALRFPPRAAAAPRPAPVLAKALLGLIYAPALALGLAEVALATGAIWLPATLGASLGVLDRAAYLLFGAYLLAAAALFARQVRRASGQTALQARIMAWGTALAAAPFLALYVIPFAAGADLPAWSNAAVLPLALVPLAFGYAIWRHQLLEAEIVFRRGVVYTLATIAVVAAYWGVIALAGALVHARLPNAPGGGWAVWLLAILVTAVLFEPLKHWLRERVDRWFYRERYDYRRTLVAFARQLNAAPDLDRMLPQVLDRLTRTLLLLRSAVFVLAPDDGHFVLGLGHGLDAPAGAAAPWLDAHFLRPAAPRLFLEHPRGPGLRENLHYFIPCQLQGRTVAVLGLGKTVLGEYLSGEDLALVETLAGHLAVAVENARLMAALRQKAEEFQRLKDFHQNIVESVQVGIIATSLDGVVESWNAQMEVLSARPRAHAVGRRIGELLGPAFAAEFDGAAAGGRIHTASKFRMDALCDGPRLVDLAIAPLLSQRLERVGHIVLLSDVTAESEMQQRLIQADRLRSVGLLAAGVAHEVNTPLAVISSYTQMLAKQTPAGDPRAPVLDTITRQTFRASEIVGNLLNFSRTGAAVFRRVEVNAAVRDTLALVEHPLRSAGIHVIAALHPDAGDGPLAVDGDAGKLQQVLLNLVLNARDAMPSGGTLRIATGRSPDRAWIEVADSGRGIPPELQHRIFDPFFTTKSDLRAGAAAGSASMSTGTGLGLAVTYGIVQEHGGHIEVASAPGCGATFRVELPLAAPLPALAGAGN